MENYIIKFKNDLRAKQATNKKLINHFETRLSLLELILTVKPTLIAELETNDIDLNFFRAPIIYSIEETKKNLMNLTSKKRINKKKTEQELEKLKIYYNAIKDFLEFIKTQQIITQNIINAFENDKIKDPINNMEELYQQLNYTSLSIDEISKIIGMAIAFNTKYAKRNKKHNIKNINIINALSVYYNLDGTFKYNEDTKTFKDLIELLLINDSYLNAVFEKLTKDFTTFSIEELVKLLETNNEKLRNSTTLLEETIKPKQTEIYTISPNTIKALQELRKYYKNGTIIEIPKNLEAFNKILDETNLDDLEKKYIISLIDEQIANKKSMIISKYLTKDEQITYKKSINLLNSFTHSNSDTYTLKQYIEELQTILNMLETETNEEDKEYLLNEIPSIISELSLICDRYTIENKESTNRFIFLLNKNNIPYITEDIDSLDSSYKKAIYSLIPKINKPNESYFRKVLNNEELSYNMYEVTSQRAHIAFVEVDAGIYVIIGANIPRHGYKELNNRLKANQLVIKKIEEIVKNPETRNQILKSNEEYLTLVSESNNITSLNKLTLKLHN